MGPLKTKNLMYTKGNNQSSEEEIHRRAGIFASYMSNRERVYIQNIQRAQRTEKTDDLILKWAKRLNREFAKEEIKMPKKFKDMINILSN